MQQETSGGRQRSGLGEPTTTQSLVILLALAGSKRADVDELRRRTRLGQSGFENLLNWLQRRGLVEVSASIEGNGTAETLSLTEDGEAVLIRLLEQTCELPEFR